MSGDPSHFNMTVILRLPKNTKEVRPSILDKFILKYVGEENVELLRPFTLPNEWELELKSEVIREKLLRMEKTKIKKWTCWILPFSILEVRGYVHWLPIAISNDTVKEFLSQYGQVVFVENRTPHNWESTIANESRYYALYLNERMQRSDIPHFKKFEDFLCFITVRGRRPACIHCRALGHKKSQCEIRQMKFSSYCRKQRYSANDIRIEQESSNIIESTSDSSSTTTNSLVTKQVCIEREPSIEPMVDSTSQVCIKSEASAPSSYIKTPSLIFQVCTENELSSVDEASQICLKNEPSTSITSTSYFETEQSTASNPTIATLVPTQTCPKSETSTTSNSNSTILTTSEVCTENEANLECSSVISIDSTSQISIENQGIDNSNTEEAMVGSSRVSSAWESADDDIELEKQIFLAIHYLGKWKMAIDKLIDDRLKIQ